MAQSTPEQLAADEEFIRRFSKSQCTLYAYILGLTYSSSDADDVLQDVNLALWKKRDTYNPKYEFIPWAIGFARLEVNNHRKRSGRKKLLFSDDVLNVLADEWPQDVSFQEQRLTALASCIKKLGPTESECISEFYRRGTSVSELSQKQNKPVSTIYKILNRARKSLRLCIQGTIAQSSHPSHQT